VKRLKDLKQLLHTAAYHPVEIERHLDPDKMQAILKDGYPVHGFPWVHLRYDVDKGRWQERPGLCRNVADLLKLVGKDNYYHAFKDDPVAQLYCLAEGGEAPVEASEKLAEAFGIRKDGTRFDSEFLRFFDREK